MRWLKKSKKVFLALHVITLNRKDLLEFLIKESSEYFDAIRICDGGSTDGTQDMVRKYGCELYEREWDDKYHEQDNFLLGKSKPKEWVMIMDDDECPSRELLSHMRSIIDVARQNKKNMISLPSILVLDGEPAFETNEFIQKCNASHPEAFFRKFWLFEYDKTVKSYGSPHRAVESQKGWDTWHQPYPYYHFKTSWSFLINDCIHGWIYPPGQGYTPGQAEEMYQALPEFERSNDIEPFILEGKFDQKFIDFAEKYKDSNRPIRNWYNAIEAVRTGFESVQNVFDLDKISGYHGTIYRDEPS